MTDYLIDLLFSFRGRASRREWALGLIAVAAAVVLGFAFFNDASFDESANSVVGAPTMALFLWLLFCLFVLTAICAKRLAEAGQPRWLAATIGLPLAVVVSAWGLGYFLHPLSPGIESLAFWVLLALPLPALALCAR